MFTSSEAGALQGGYGRDMSYQIARAHIRDLPRVKPLWKSMLRRYADVAGGDWPVRDPATAWARRHEEYLSWLNEGAGVIFLAIDSETQGIYLLNEFRNVSREDLSALCLDLLDRGLGERLCSYIHLDGDLTTTKNLLNSNICCIENDCIAVLGCCPLLKK